MLEELITDRPPDRDNTGPDTQAVIDEAVASLGNLRGLSWLGHGRIQLHLLHSLRLEIDQQIILAAELAADQDPDTD